MMRAMVFDRYGGPEVLHSVQMPDPVASTGQVVIRVMAAGVNPADYKWRSGMFESLVPVSLPHVLGYDVAGSIESVGEGVSGLAAGDRVVTMLDHIRKGGYAERAAADSIHVAKMPAGMDFDLAAAVPCAALTGAQAIDEGLQTGEGRRLLITGATGAVGLVSLFTALRRGTRVVAAVRERHVAAARAFGASETIVLGGQSWDGEPFDDIFDTVGGEAVARLCRHLKPGGRIVTVATTPIDPVGLAATPEFFAVHHDGKRLRALLEDVAAGRLPIRVGQRLPLEKASEAQRLVEAGGLIGKVVLIPEPG